MEIFGLISLSSFIVCIADSYTEKQVFNLCMFLHSLLKMVVYDIFLQGRVLVLRLTSNLADQITLNTKDKGRVILIYY